MGYATSYKLHVENPPKGFTKKTLAKIIRENEEMSYALEEDGSTAESCKWYDCDTDMLRISLKYPEVLFILSGTGEESGDIWRTYFKNGKMQHARAMIAFESYDPEKME